MKFFKSLKNTATGFLDPYRQKSPASYAAAQQAVGGLLILDGFVGIENPFDGKNKRPGIFGSLVGIAVGAVFVFGIGFVTNLTGINKMTATTTATVVSVGAPETSNTNNSNNQSTSSSCPLTVHYIVNGQEYTKQSSISSSSNCSLSAGQSVPINYDPANPGSWAYDLETINKVIKFFPLIGGLVMITSLGTFLIRLLSIIFGWKILRSGRALAATLPAGTTLDTMKSEIRNNFLGQVFNFGGSQPSATTTTQSNPPKTS